MLSVRTLSDSKDASYHAPVICLDSGIVAFHEQGQALHLWLRLNIKLNSKQNKSKISRKFTFFNIFSI